MLPVGASNPDFAVTSALTPKNQFSPWVVNMKKSGSQTLLSAKLRQAKLAVEVEILCDRVDMNGADGVQADFKGMQKDLKKLLKL